MMPDSIFHLNKIIFNVAPTYKKLLKYLHDDGLLAVPFDKKVDLCVTKKRIMK